MKKNVIFVFVFAAVILGLVQLHTMSLEDLKDQSVNVNGIADISYPSSIEARNDIPFGLLIKPDDKKLLPDTIDYEQFRPHLILLEKGFDEKDSVQLREFPNIVVNAIALEGFDASILETEYVASLANNISKMISENAQRSSSAISDWKTLPLSDMNGAKALRFEYKLESQDKKVLNIALSYLFKGNKQVEVTLATPDKNKDKWVTIYDDVLNTVSIN